ncbi:S8 family serine peptidase [Pedobacter sp. SYSU D00535]|uniref:S8 family serine peptidase n=1 Tax=Pedobacter sp. SYSU D00535 TaxID=2810308 RepID=UPI001A96BB32|nr:S8 family serine peptidase [Pedobacter sp. SYSU D00535]
MKEILLAALFLLQAFSVFSQTVTPKSSTASSSLGRDNYLPNTVIVKFKTSPAQRSKTLSLGPDIQLKSASVEKVEQKFPEGQKSDKRTLQREDKSGLSRIYELKFTGATVEQVIEELLSDPNVEYAEPSFIRRTYYTPNDPAFLNNLQNSLTRINAPRAWDLIRNAAPVILAIVDSGSDLNHPDLSANIYYNVNDPVNGVDDDADGYTDNYWGWDFVGATATNLREDNNPNVTNAANDHGVHVSGIAGAVTDNARGMASVSFNTARLLIVKVAPDDAGTDIYRGYEGIKYAADHGASIINCSWGGENRSQYEQDVVNYTINKGCLIVAAAGNSGGETPQYPAGYEGVLAVANVELNDQRSASSNYGHYVSISAPGANIYSTTVNNSYTQKTGTSMASPLVAGAAALVKAYMPHLSMQQVGEQLRSTADNIDDRNELYAGRLGKGRLNVYRALTESPPSIRRQDLTFVDKGNGTYPAGDTVRILADLKNFLHPVTNLQVRLVSTSPYVEITHSQFIVPSLGQLQTVDDVGPFRVYIKPETPDNTTVEFRLEYLANNGTYTDFESFLLVVARDFINLRTPQIASTITSIGRIGFLIPGIDDGTLGFRYQDSQLLYEGALMIGTSASRVSNNARSEDESYDDHFVKEIKVQATSVDGRLETVSLFNDSGSPNPLNIDVRQRSYVFSDIDKQKFLITEYEIINTNNTNLNNVFAGLYTDWDIEGGATNATQYIPASRLAYVYDKKDSGLPYAGVKILTEERPPVYYPLSYMLANDPLKEDFTITEKYLTLSSGVESTGLGHTTTNGLDVSFVSGNGPYFIPAKGSVKVAFALIGGDNLEDLQASATTAQQVYNALNPGQPMPDVKELAISSYPNPISDNYTRVVLSLPEEGTVSLDLYNVLGMKVQNLIKDERFPKGVYASSFVLKDVASGMYFLRLRYNNTIKTHKVSVFR